MSKSEIALLAFNVFALLAAVGGLVSGHMDPMGMALVFSLLALLANSAYVLRRSGKHERTASPAPARLAQPVDELDARALLDIDARLEALERREREMEEEERIRRMWAQGEQRAPASSAPAGGGSERERVR